MWSRGQSDPPQSQQTKIYCNIILHFKGHPWIPSSNGEWLHRSGEGHTGHSVSYAVIPRWLLRSREHSGKPKLHNKNIIQDAIPVRVSILNSQQSRRTVTSKLKRILVTSRMPSRSLDDWCDRGNVVLHQSKKQKLSSEIRYQFKSELSSPSSRGERSKTSWQAKTNFFMILDLILDLFFEKIHESGP